jgi:hypothetical protein
MRYCLHYQRRIRTKIPKCCSARHLSCVVSVLILLSSFGKPFAQSSAGEFRLSPQDISDVIASYRSVDPAASVKLLQQEMPLPVADEKFRASIMQHLPASLMRLQVNDDDLKEHVRNVLEPVLSLYGRLHVFEIVVIRHPIPLLMSDSGVALIITTGMIERATSDDELLGYVAHEIGHEFFATWSVPAKQLLHIASTNLNERAITRKMAEVLALIELDCDAFAALTLVALKRNPLAFIEGLERTGKDFPAYAGNNHPLDTSRRSVVSGILPTGALSISAQQSEAFKNLKTFLLTDHARLLNFSHLPITFPRYGSRTKAIL